MATLLLGTAVALLLLAAPAAAEVRTGQATGAVNGDKQGEADLVEASATYDTGTGSVTFTGTTREAPGPNPTLLFVDALGTEGATCGLPGISVGWGYLSHEAAWTEREPGGQTTPAEAAAWSLAGTTTTLSVTSSRLVDRGFDCAEVVVLEAREGVVGQEQPLVVDGLRFPILGPESSPPSGSSPPPSSPPPGSSTPASKPAALKIGKLATLRVPRGEWRTVKVRVSDPGGTATGPVNLKARAPDGVLLRPRSHKVALGPLQPGQTKTVDLRIELTEGARARSTISLTATAPGLVANRSLVVRALGG